MPVPAQTSHKTKPKPASNFRRGMFFLPRNGPVRKLPMFFSAPSAAVSTHCFPFSFSPTANFCSPIVHSNNGKTGTQTPQPNIHTFIHVSSVCASCARTLFFPLCNFVLCSLFFFNSCASHVWTHTQRARLTNSPPPARDGPYPTALCFPTMNVQRKRSPSLYTAACLSFFLPFFFYSFFSDRKDDSMQAKKVRLGAGWPGECSCSQTLRRPLFRLLSLVL